MNALNSLIKKHEPLGIYNITEGGNIHCELEAYAEGLDMLSNELDTLLTECFSATAESFGLEEREKLWGRVRDDLSTEKRRQMLLLRSSFSLADFTLNGAQKIVSFLGLDAQVQEYPRMQRLVIDVSKEGFTEGQKKWIRSQLDALFPAHLETDIVWQGFSFDDADSKNLTFDNIDEKSLPWSEIDTYTIKN